MSSTMPRGGLRPCTRSIHWPDRSARAAKFVAPRAIASRSAPSDDLGARDGFLLDGRGSSAMGVGQGSTGIPATVLLGGGRPVATYIGVRALPCRDPGSVRFCD